MTKYWDKVDNGIQQEKGAVSRFFSEKIFLFSVQQYDLSETLIYRNIDVNKRY